MHSNITLDDPDFTRQYKRVERLLDSLEEDEDYINELGTASSGSSSPMDFTTEEQAPSSASPSSSSRHELITLAPMLPESEEKSSSERQQPLTPLPIPPLFPCLIPSVPARILPQNETQAQLVEPLNLPEPAAQPVAGANSSSQGFLVQHQNEQQDQEQQQQQQADDAATSSGSLLTTPSSLALPSPLTDAAANAANTAKAAATAATATAATTTTAAAAGPTASSPPFSLPAPLAHEPVLRFEYGEQLVQGENKADFCAVGRELHWPEFVKLCRSYGADEVALREKADRYVALRNARRKFEVVAMDVQAKYGWEDFEREMKARGMSRQLCEMAAEHFGLEIEHLVREGGEKARVEELEVRKGLVLELYK